jgi:hypothetical protein
MHYELEIKTFTTPRKYQLINESYVYHEPLMNFESYRNAIFSSKFTQNLIMNDLWIRNFIHEWINIEKPLNGTSGVVGDLQQQHLGFVGNHHVK